MSHDQTKRGAQPKRDAGGKMKSMRSSHYSQLEIFCGGFSLCLQETFFASLLVSCNGLFSSCSYPADIISVKEALYVLLNRCICKPVDSISGKTGQAFALQKVSAFL